MESVKQVVDDWGGMPEGPEREAFFEQVDTLASQVARQVEAALAVLARSDVDAQATTPVSVMRAAAGAASALLEGAGVPPVRRDRFAQERFPEDLYGLVPSSLKEVDPSLSDIAVAWGAAKAMAHHRRHRGPSQT
jgi:hypothetical protein